MGIKRNIKNFFRRIRKVTKLEKEFLSTEHKKLESINKKKLIFNCVDKPLVSIIIPFYNQEIFTWNCLYYLHKNLSDKYPYEIILIDDNSSETYDFSNAKGINIIKNETNLGFLKNINKGIINAKGKYIYILNNDTEVQESFLDELFYVFETKKNVGAVGSMLLNPNNTLQEAGSVFLKDFNIHQVVRKRKLYYPEVNYIYKVDYCSGCSLLFKKYKDDGKTLNLLDERFAPAYFEETDFCFDLKYNQNKNVYFTPFSKVLHYNGVSYNGKENSSNESIKRKEELFKINKEKFWNKWKEQIASIKATNVEERIVELCDNKSIVFVSGIIPEHDKDSGSNRLKEIIASFINNGYHTTLVVENTYHTNKYINFYQRMGVNVFYEYKKYKDFSKFLLKNIPSTNLVWYYGPDTFIKSYAKLKNILKKAKHVYDMVDIHHLRYERAIELEPKRLSFRKKYRRYKKIETKFVKNADYVIAISDAEKDFMKDFYLENKLITVSNIHYPKIKKDLIKPFSERKDIIFIGSTHHPNLNAIYFLYNEIMPFLWDILPEIKVNVIGNINEAVHDINDDRFVFHGFVPDVEFLFNNSKLMVAPLQIGAGVKGKIGQAFEYYLPVVTTTIGAEGMFLKNEENVLIADNPKDFAESIIKVYNDENTWNKLSNNSENSLYPFSIEKVNDIIKENF